MRGSLLQSVSAQALLATKGLLHRPYRLCYFRQFEQNLFELELPTLQHRHKSLTI